VAALSGQGTYILILALERSQTLQIGKLDRSLLLAGFYSYVGSAFGSGGLSGRLKHHLSVVQRPHWHIDYLRQAASVIEIWALESDTAREHDWAALLTTLPSISNSLAKFGASDCACPSHLFYFREQPALEAFQTLASHAFPNDPPIQSVRV